MLVSLSSGVRGADPRGHPVAWAVAWGPGGGVPSVLRREECQGDVCHPGAPPRHGGEGTTDTQGDCLQPGLCGCPGEEGRRGGGSGWVCVYGWWGWGGGVGGWFVCVCVHARVCIYLCKCVCVWFCICILCLHMNVYLLLSFGVCVCVCICVHLYVIIYVLFDEIFFFFFSCWILWPLKMCKLFGV